MMLAIRSSGVPALCMKSIKYELNSGTRSPTSYMANSTARTRCLDSTNLSREKKAPII
jgi:hypothetical protein